MNIRHFAVLCTSMLVLQFCHTSVRANPACTVLGDNNSDCRISAADFDDLTVCLQGPNVAVPAECGCFDFDSDSAVDMADFAAFQQQFTGANLVPGCTLTVRADEPGTLRPNPVASPGTGVWGIPQAPDSDSVYNFSGEFQLTEIDLSIRGRGFDFVWARRYRSQVGVPTTMGVGWDHSYNIFLQASGGNLILHNGDGRADEYCLNANGTWTHPEFFRQIETSGNGYRMVSHDRAQWNFNGFNGLPDDGKLTSMSDRNGNTMIFGYDPTGRLEVIHDTLHFNGNPRGIQIAYNTDGFISSVTDYAGRQVTYDYYQNADVGGDLGDLRSVTTPIVVGTPNGNDFPTGKTTVYSYSEGFADARLNHNLLTITDPKGQTYLRNNYAASLNPADLEFDRIVRQQFGDALDQYQFFYLTETPSPANNFATARCIVNDRMGNVSESYHDHRNRLVMLRVFTGRANPATTTTDVLNRPVNPLRPNDPPFYETRYGYNENSLLTHVLHAEQNEVHYVYEGDVDYFAPPRRRCERVRCVTNPGPRGGDQPSIIEEYEYDPLVNFDTGQVTRAVDGRGNATLHLYDQAGNRTRTTQRLASVVDDYSYNGFGQLIAHVHPDNGSGHRRVDAYNYYPLAAGPQYGYLQAVVTDATVLALTTQFEYDPVGNNTRVVDPKGNDTQYEFNALDQVVRVLSREADAVGTRYETVRFYDANDNVVRLDIENRDDQGALLPNQHYTTIYEYDILDHVVRTTEEVDQNQNIRTEYAYDANRNRTVVRSGEATSGNQPNNTVVHEYDERDLLFRTTRGTSSADESTDQWDYDGNGNRTSFVGGLQGVTPREEIYLFDGYDRCVVRVDPMGNELLYAYDANHNVVGTEVLGEPNDVVGGTGNVRLREAIYVYDAMDRLTQQDALFFDSSQAPLTDGVSRTTLVYSDSSQLLQSTDDNSHVSTYAYDTVNRRSVCIDAKGNRVDYSYDLNSNIITVTETEKSDLGLADEVFVTTYTYDGLDRATSTTDSSGNTNTMAYDSRDNHTVTVDALLNETRHLFDGINRSLGTVHDMDGDGADGDGTDITITRVYDDNARLIQAIDDNGNATGYQYDELDRVVAIHRADSTSESYQYDVHDNLTSKTDANGTVIAAAYDRLDRLESTSVTAGTGVSTDTTFQQFAYDGLSRCVRAEDDDSVVTRAYDSLSHIVGETLNGDTTSSTFDGVGNRLTCAYPSGTALTYNYDDLDRISSINAGGSLVSSYLYVGPSRVARQQYGNGATADYVYDGIQGVPNPPGDFGVKRIVGITHASGGTPIDDRTFTWDAMYNKYERRDVRVGGPGLRHAYSFDRAYRLIGGLEEDGLGIATRILQYQLDGTGNRQSIGGFGGVTGSYTLDPASPPADAQVNQYTETPRDQRLYDENGNLTVAVTPIGNTDFEYDAYDRLVTYIDTLNGVTIDYDYDAFGRRIGTTRTGGGPSLGCRYRYLGTQVIEDLDPNGVAIATYVHGARGNDIVCVEQGGQIVYHHLDDVGNTTALSNVNGAAVERYEYDDFGVPHVFDGAGNLLAGSAFNNEYLFLGRRWNPDTGLYLVGSRYFDPFNGRSTTRDPAGMWADAAHTGNGYQDRGGNPWNGEATGGGFGGHRGHGKSTGRRMHRPINIAPAIASATDHNSSRSNKTSSTRATDHNSSRSNKTSSNRAAAATDHNSSRSNKTSSTRATDHNSSRSNKTSSNRAAAATDHNSSRSNKTSSTRATDHNSSRSNKTSSNRAAPATDHNSSRSNKTSSTRATDHNSSRSNKTSSNRAAPATDHNSSRSNKTSSTRVAPGGGNSCPAGRPYRCPDGSCQATAAYCTTYNVPAGVRYTGPGVPTLPGGGRLGNHPNVCHFVGAVTTQGSVMTGGGHTGRDDTLWMHCQGVFDGHVTVLK